MRDQIECVESVILYMQTELSEMLGRCRIALKGEAVKPTDNTQSTKCRCATPSPVAHSCGECGGIFDCDSNT